MTRYRGLVCDLDGVVYRGPTAVPGAVETLNRTIGDGTSVVFATNNASRPPDSVGDHLRELGLGRGDWSVVTSSQAAAAHLTDRLPPGSRVCAVGGPGVADALTEAGLTPVRVAQLAGTSVEAVVQGLGVDVTWGELAEVGHLVRAGALWVATNVDEMLPTARGPAPGNGTLVAAVRATTTTAPHVVGKPGAALFDLARSGLGTERQETLVCGDRLDTDIAGANAAGLDSLFVLSGACDLKELAFAPASARPTYVAGDLTGLLQPPLPLGDVPEDSVGIRPDGVVEMPTGNNHGRLLLSVVTTVWASLDDGREVSPDTTMWAQMSSRLGLAPP